MTNGSPRVPAYEEDEMSEGQTCYENDEAFCEDQMCLRTGCRLKNARTNLRFSECPRCGINYDASCPECGGLKYYKGGY